MKYDKIAMVAQQPGLSTVVVLDRIEPGIEPEYCIHGRATCGRCREWVWLGHKTHDIVADGNVMPICQQCAAEIIPKGAKPISRVTDHRRADGPHE